MLILSVESSCDETAVALVRDGREILTDCIASQVELHRIYGGVVPEIASRKHIEAIYGLAEQALQRANVTRGEIDAVAVTVARLINGVGHDFKNGMGAALHAVRAKDDRRALAHTVGAFELAYGFVSVFLLFFRHSSPCFAAFFYGNTA